MKFLYVDESGDQSHSDYFFMTGLLIDAYRMPKKSKEINKLISDFLKLHPSAPKEIKTSQLINGKGKWSKVNADDRKKFIVDLCNTALACCKIYTYGLSFSKFAEFIKDQNYHFNQSYWIAASMFLSSLVQKKMQKEANNKGLTILVFDDNKQYMEQLSEALYDAPDCYDAIYDFNDAKKGTERFNQIIHTAFSIKSQHCFLVQTADCISYIYRRRYELKDQRESWDGEAEFYNQLYTQLEKKRETIGTVKNKNDQTVMFFKQVSPETWKL